MTKGLLNKYILTQISYLNIVSLYRDKNVKVTFAKNIITSFPDFKPISLTIYIFENDFYLMLLFFKLW